MSRTIIYRWFEGESPASLPVTQIYGFCFGDEDRILLIEDRGFFNLPGGSPEPGETSEETLRREVYEEARVLLGGVRRLGYQLVENDPSHMGGSSYAQLRAIAHIERVLPPAPDPATGIQFDRMLRPWFEIADLLGWGESGEKQVRSACKLAADVWGMEFTR